MEKRVRQWFVTALVSILLAPVLGWLALARDSPAFDLQRILYVWAMWGCVLLALTGLVAGIASALRMPKTETG